MENLNQLYNKEISKLVTDVFNNIKQDVSLTFWRTSYGKDTILKYFQISYNYFRSILCISETQDESLILSLTPLTRASFEILFLILYLMDDFEERTLKLAKILDRERKRELDCYGKYYSDKSEWENYISNQRIKLPNFQKSIENEFSQLGNNLINWEKGTKFPGFKEMKNELKNIETKNFFEWLHELHYPQLSNTSHPEPSAVALFSAINHQNGKEVQEDRKNFIIWLSLLTLVSLISEIEIKLNYGLKPNLISLWHKLEDSNFWAKEFYERRYQKLL